MTSSTKGKNQMITKNKIDTKDNQAIMDEVCRLFIKEGAEQCANSDGCTYQPNCERQVGCAIGCLIHDYEGWEELEGESINSLMKDENPIVLSLFNEEQVPFLISIQLTHDISFSGTTLSRCVRIAGLCRRFNLTIPSYVQDIIDKES